MKSVEETPAEAAEESEERPYRTILEVWTAVLEPIAAERARRPNMQWSVRIVNAYPQVRYADMAPFKELYFAKAQRLADILQDSISVDDECLKRVDAAEDARYNGGIYRNVLTDWQKEFLLWELQWDADSEHAAVEVAAIAEIHKMFFDATGLVGLLDQIDLQFTDADRDALTAELQRVKEDFDGRG